MTTSPVAELCRITVFGPDKRVDLAVPVAISIAGLLPVLLRHTSEPATRNQVGATWVLQRLGGDPMQPTDTPESLDWHEGEQLYLRRTEAAFPQLYFDDVADGMASTVTGLPSRWKAEYNRWLFLGVAVALLGLVARVLLDPNVQQVSVALSILVSVALLGGAVAVARLELDPAMILLLGLGGAAFAALAAALGDGGLVAVQHFDSEPMFAAGSGAMAAAAVLILARVAVAPTIPFVPFGVVLLVGGMVALAEFLGLGAEMTQLEIAGTLSAAMLLVLVFSPRAVIRVAGLHVPQLPRTAEEMQQDIQPAPAPDLARRTIFADQCLAVVTVTTAAVLAVAAPILVGGGPYATALEVALLVTALVRAGSFQGIGQRIALTAAGGWGVAVVVLSLVARTTPTEQVFLLVVLGGGFVALLGAMARPVDRRMLPIWGHLANWLELFSAAATLPLVLELFGVYEWARGLMS
jgi:type VII secretion integral membrane protein EccD